MFSPIKNTKVYEQVIEQIKDMIKTGKLKRGDKLLPERELAEELQVSRTSVREALRALEILGLTESRQGEGNFIKEDLQNSLLEPFSIMFMLHGSKQIEILELRKIVETETAALAAKHISDEEIIEIKEIIDILNNTDDEEISAKMDKELHFKIAQASKNFLVLNILLAVSSLIDSFIKTTRMNILLKDENKMILRQQHESIYKALADREPAAAAYAMRKHLEFTCDYLMTENHE